MSAPAHLLWQPYLQVRWWAGADPRHCPVRSEQFWPGPWRTLDDLRAQLDDWFDARRGPGRPDRDATWTVEVHGVTTRDFTEVLWLRGNVYPPEHFWRELNEGNSWFEVDERGSW